MSGKRAPKIPFRATLSGRRGVASQEVEVIAKSAGHFLVKTLTGEGLVGFKSHVPAAWFSKELVDLRAPPKALPRRTRALGHQWDAVLRPLDLADKTVTWVCKNCPEVQTKGFGPGHNEDWFPLPKACPNSPRRNET
jgi:hypothetical protein